MTKRLVIFAAALVMTTGAAMAQSTSSESTTTVTPSVEPPQARTLSESHSEKNVSPDGTRTTSSETTYRDSAGGVHESVTRTRQESRGIGHNDQKLVEHHHRIIRSTGRVGAAHSGTRN